jgi:hypothetical protein
MFGLGALQMYVRSLYTSMLDDVGIEIDPKGNSEQVKEISPE